MEKYVLLLISMFTWLLSGAQKRYALIIGNSNYKSQNVLKNPLSDARLLAGALTGCGFQVEKKEDISRKEMLSAINEFYKKIKADPCVALFYYSGHGIQYEGENYMIPVDAQIQSKSDIEFDCVNLGRVLGCMEESQSITNIIILDACRKDPFANAWYRGEGDKGLAVIRKTPHESYIAFATAPGEVANDGTDNNSPFTKALARHILEPGVNIEAVFKRVNNDVKKQYPQQVPWTNSSLGIDFYFKEPGAPDARNNTSDQKARQADEALNNKSKKADDAKEKVSESATDPGNSSPLSVALEAIRKNLVLVEGGEFYMGTSGGNNDESPVHKVQLTSFYLSKFEVSQSQWKAVMGANPSLAQRECNECPVDNVSWEDANKFIETLNQLMGEKYSLPTEAQWEYAARGGKLKMNSKFSGASRIEKLGWYYENSAGKTHPVGKLSGNEMNLFDMSGNVAEWCSDWYDISYYNRSEAKNPTGPDSGKNRVLRGGSWDDYDANCRVFTRNKNVPGFRSKMTGFRIAKPIAAN